MAAGWTARLCAGEKDSLSETERGTQVPHNSWTQPPSLRPFKHHPDAGNSKNLSFIILEHTHPARPFNLLLLFPNLCIHPFLSSTTYHHCSPPFPGTFLPHTQTHARTFISLSVLSGPTLYPNSLWQSVWWSQVSGFK